MAIYFDRNFNKALRGYNTEEVDAALDAIVIHCEELEEANREFAEANNNLIDENSFLKTELEQLKSKLSENLAKLQKVEETYNLYRQKYGEAKDIIERAKKSSFDIVTEANNNAKNIVQNAESQAETIISEAKAREEAETAFAKAERKAVISKLDKEIEAKKTISSQLEEDFLAFKASISEDIAEIMAKLELRDIKAALKPQKIQKITPEPVVEAPVVESEPEPEPIAGESVVPEPAAVDLSEPPDIADIPIIPFDAIQDAYLDPPPAVSSAINEVRRPDTEFSKIKNTLEGINDKIKNNKSTPHIN